MDPLPCNTALLVKKNTLAVGRGKSGRMYVPGGLESQVNGAGGLFADYRGAIQDAFDAFLAELLAATPAVTPVVNHGDGSWDDVEGFEVDQKCATQRRRMRP